MDPKSVAKAVYAFSILMMLAGVYMLVVIVPIMPGALQVIYALVAAGVIGFGYILFQRARRIMQLQARRRPARPKRAALALALLLPLLVGVTASAQVYTPQPAPWENLADWCAETRNKIIVAEVLVLLLAVFFVMLGFAGFLLAQTPMAEVFRGFSSVALWGTFFSFILIGLTWNLHNGITIAGDTCSPSWDALATNGPPLLRMVLSFLGYGG